MPKTRTLADYNQSPDDFFKAEEEGQGPEGFIDFGGGAVLPVKNGRVQFPRAGKAARPTKPMRGNMFGTLPTPAEQYEMSQGMASQAMDAIQRENDSRVSQRREMRRLGADYEMERLRQQGANYRANVDAEAQLIRQLLADM